MSDARMDRCNAEYRALKMRLKKAGLTVEKPGPYGGRNTLPEHCMDAMVVCEDGDTIAEVRLNTGAGYYTAFNGWKVRLASYEPRGDYHMRGNQTDPANTYHWGSGNFGSTAGAVNKIIAAKGTAITNTQKLIGELKHDSALVMRSLRDVRSSRKYVFRDVLLHQQIVNALAGTDMPEALEEAVNKAQELIEQEDKARDKYNELGRLIDKLEEEDES
jgi:hypothetical protein